MTSAILLTLFAPALLTFAVVEGTADSTPWIAGIAAVLVTGLMIPVVRSMMLREDARVKEAAEAAERRETREEKRAEAFQQQVAALGAILTELRLLNEHHKDLDQNRAEAVKEILARIDGLPDRIVKKCNGG